MKKIIFIAFLMTLALITRSQSTELSEAVANKFSDRMTDSLKLNAQEKQGVLEANRMIAKLKFQARNNYKQMDSLTLYTQRIEDMRDSLYRRVLTDEKFKQYANKKDKIINNN